MPRTSRSRLRNAYLVSGDEPLLVAEAADAVRARARESGFSERETYFIERGCELGCSQRRREQRLSLFAARAHHRNPARKRQAWRRRRRGSGENLRN